MYKFVGTDEDELKFLVGKELRQVCYGLYDVQFNFEDELAISAFYKTIFYNHASEERVMDISSGVYSPIPINSLLGKKTSSLEIVNHESLMLSFENTEKLFVDGSDLKLECYTISYRGAVYVI